jgi:hypothetical protein
MQVPCACRRDKTALHDAVLRFVPCFITLSILHSLCMAAGEGMLERCKHLKESEKSIYDVQNRHFIWHKSHEPAEHIPSATLSVVW